MRYVSSLSVTLVLNWLCWAHDDVRICFVFSFFFFLTQWRSLYLTVWKLMTKMKWLKFFFLYNCQHVLCFSLCTLLSQCLFKVETCSEYLKVSSKPNEVSVTLPSAASATHCFLFFVSTRAGRGGGGSKLCGLSRRRLRRGSRWPVFSPLRSLSRSLSAECQVSLGLFPSSPFFFFIIIVWVSCRCYFKVVSLALTVCVWLVDSTCWLF